MDLKIREKRAYVLCIDNNLIGVMRYNLFWDNIPFMTLINIENTHHGKGYGRQAMLYWESEMRNCGYMLKLLSENEVFGL